MANHEKRAHSLAIASAIALVVAVASVGVVLTVRDIRDERVAEAEDAFYIPPNPLPPGRPGDLIRYEPAEFGPPGVSSWRILYLSENALGQRTASSGMLFAPQGPVPAGGRPVVAWAHGTVGMGSACAPSRSSNPLADMNWLAGMVGNGWVVTATDYAGLGTPGVEGFLIGGSEARDVLNSVRAARKIPEAGGGTRFATWGHSQGGHASLFAASAASLYAPELQLVAASAAAPAAELSALIHQQYTTAVSWAIAPEVTVAWPEIYPELPVSDVVTSAGLENFKRLAYECIAAAAVESDVRWKLGETFFSKDPTTVPLWQSAMSRETVMATSPQIPVYVAQGLSDEVVLPNTTALLATSFCSAGSTISLQWMPGVDHLHAADASAPDISVWLQNRFAGVAATSTCSTPPPIPPAQ